MAVEKSVRLRLRKAHTSTRRFSHQTSDGNCVRYTAEDEEGVTAKWCYLDSAVIEIPFIDALPTVSACFSTKRKRPKVFRKLDVDGDGTVSSLEFKRGLRKLRIGDYLSEKDVRRCWGESTLKACCRCHKCLS